MMNCRPGKPLSGELKSFVEGAGESGVVFMSLGTALNASEMDEGRRNMFVNVFK